MRFIIILIAIIIANPALAFECTKLAFINNNTKKAIYNVEQATTPEQRAQGLMFRKSLPENNGMIFNWKIADKRAMWMKNTYIPLDMIFINDNKVVGVLENIPPHSLQPRSVDTIVNQILEINAGQAQKNSISIGDTVKCFN